MMGKIIEVIKALYLMVSCVLPFAYLLAAIIKAAERDPLPDLPLAVMLGVSVLNIGFAIYFIFADGSISKLFRWLVLPGEGKSFLDKIPGVAQIAALLLFAAGFYWVTTSEALRPLVETITAVLLMVIVVGLAILWRVGLWVLALRIYHKIWGK